MTKEKIIIFDIDWVLAKMKEDFNYTHDGTEEVISINRTILALFKLHENETMIKTFLVTWRNKDEVTEDWLSKNWFSYNEIVYNSYTSNKPKNHIVKEEVFKKLMYSYDIVAVIDDNPNVAEVCSKMRIPCFLYSNNS